jgi:hypothetical protein
MLRHYSILASLGFYCGLLVGEATSQPSQRELNGFLLGQSRRAITSSFQEMIEIRNHEDGWRDVLYWLDSTHSGYMIFGFADTNRGCTAVQLTGQPTLTTLPFLGLRLGDSRASVLAKLGTPDRVQHIDDADVDCYYFPQRNYSVEFDSLDRLFSIRIMRDDGLNDTIPRQMPDLASVISALSTSNTDLILDHLAPDVEIYAADSVYSFKCAARGEIADPQSQLSQMLYSGDRALARIPAVDIVEAEVDLRLIYGEGSKWVYKFRTHSMLKEIVFTIDAGQWRMWEVSFR